MPKALSLISDASLAEGTKESLKAFELVEMTLADFEQLIDRPLDPAPDMILCGPPPPEINITEIAQGLRAIYTVAHIVYVSPTTNGFDRERIKKNGFDDAFLIPFEKTEFSTFINAKLAKMGDSKVRSYRSVKLLDLETPDELDFDTYIFMPLNQKYIRYSNSGNKLNPEQVSKLKTHEVGSLHLRMADMSKFYQFTAQQLVNLGKSETISATQRQEKMRDAVRTIVSGIFSPTEESAGFDEGRQIVQDCQEIVKSYILSKGGKENSFYEKMMALAQDESGVYAGAATISSFAALFSLGLQIGNPEEVAMAGMLCDIGFSELPGDLLSKEPSERTPAEEKLYRTHPEVSLKLLKAKRVIVSENVHKMILQHHENFDGTGYPSRMPGARVMPEAQLVGIASDFRDLIRPKEGKKRMSPKDAMEHIKKKESGRRFDPAMLRKLAQLFSGDPKIA